MNDETLQPCGPPNDFNSALRHLHIASMPETVTWADAITFFLHQRKMSNIKTALKTKQVLLSKKWWGRKNGIITVTKMVKCFNQVVWAFLLHCNSSQFARLKNSRKMERAGKIPDRSVNGKSLKPRARANGTQEIVDGVQDGGGGQLVTRMLDR